MPGSTARHLIAGQPCKTCHQMLRLGAASAVGDAVNYAERTTNPAISAENGRATYCDVVG